jgi:hypothetical protein
LPVASRVSFYGHFVKDRMSLFLSLKRLLTTQMWPSPVQPPDCSAFGNTLNIPGFSILWVKAVGAWGGGGGGGGGPENGRGVPRPCDAIKRAGQAHAVRCHQAGGASPRRAMPSSGRGKPTPCDAIKRAGQAHAPTAFRHISPSRTESLFLYLLVTVQIV